MRTLENPNPNSVTDLTLVAVAGLDAEITITALINARHGEGLRRTNPTAVLAAYNAYQRLTGDVASIWDRKFLISLGLDLQLSADKQTLNTYFYDQVYGLGLGKLVVDHVGCSKGVDRWHTHHLVYYASPANLTGIFLALSAIVAISLVLLLLL